MIRRNANRTRLSLERLETRAVPALMTVGPNVNVSQLTGNQWNTSIAINPSDPDNLFAIAEQSSGAAFSSHSFDGGATWTANFPIAGGNPRAAFDDFGNLFVAADVAGKPRVYLSVNSGQTFATILNIVVPGYGRPALATGPGSVWISVRGPSGDMLAAGAPVAGFANVGSFGAFQSVPNSNGGDVSTIAVGPTGQVLVAYQFPPFSRRSILFASLDADGLGAGGFASPVVVTGTNVGSIRKIPAQVTGGIDTALSLAWDRGASPYHGRVYLAYTNAASVTTSDTNIFIQYSTNDGQSWSSAKRVNDDTTANSQFNPTIAVDQITGNVGLAWLDTRRDRGLGGPGDTNGIPNDDAQVFASVSYNGSFLFVANRQVSNLADASNSKTTGNTADYGRYMGLAFRESRFHPAWADNSPALPGNPDLPKLDLATVGVDVFPNATTAEHTDGLAADYISGNWVLAVRDRDHGIAYDPSNVILYTAPPAKTSQSGDPDFDFIGAGAGNPVWILPQVQNPGLLYLGGSSSETFGNPFDSYFESDPRIGFTAPWITLQLLDVRGPGEFSAWQTDAFGEVTVWLATSDGIGATDKLFSLPGAHIHYSWGFTTPGDYEIDVQASAYLDFPGNQTFSGVTTYKFSVDDIDNGDPPAPLPPPIGRPQLDEGMFVQRALHSPLPKGRNVGESADTSEAIRKPRPNAAANGRVLAKLEDDRFGGLFDLVSI